MRDRNRFLVLPLHSTLSTEAQHLIFNRAPPGVRKIVIATNIAGMSEYNEDIILLNPFHLFVFAANAETSITIDDIVYVIDSGRVKEKRYDANNKMSCLIEQWYISSILFPLFC